MFDPTQHPPAARADVISADGMTLVCRARDDVSTAPVKASRLAGDRGVSAVEVMWVLLIGAVAVAAMVPTFLRTTASVGDIDARANLQVAMIAAKASYEVSQSYAYNGEPLSTLSFAAQAPEFAWTTGSCVGGGASCASEQVVDVDAPGDGQGLVVAVWSSLTRTCWFGLDLETIPRRLSDDRSGVPFESGPAQAALGALDSGVVMAGVYVARSRVGVGTCTAREAISPGGLIWSAQSF
jgi:hypothetical protein